MGISRTHLRQRVQFICPHLHSGSCLSSLVLPSCPGSLSIADVTADQALVFLESSVVGGTMSLLGNAGSESDDRGG